LTVDGVTKTRFDWAKEYGISQGALRGRLTAGWSLQRALTAPLSPGKVRAGRASAMARIRSIAQGIEEQG
jgi:hypothetical protein